MRYLIKLMLKNYTIYLKNNSIQGLFSPLSEQKINKFSSHGVLKEFVMI